MPYRYEAIDSAGKRVTGLLEADSETAAEQMLWRADLTVVKLSRARASFSLQEQIPTIFAVKLQDVIFFASQLSLLIRAGLPIMAAIRVIRHQTQKAMFKKVLDQVINDINEGMPLSEACSRHRTVFPNLLLRLITVGEETGRLDVVLSRVAEYLEKRIAISRRLKGALTYPSLVLIMSMGSGYVLVTYSLPNLVQLFEEFHADLPIYTRLVMIFGRLLTDYGQMMILGFLALAGILLVYTRRPAGKRWLDYTLLRVPVIGNIVWKTGLARLSSTAQILIGAGLSVTEAVDMLIQSTENAAIREPLTEVRDDILTGTPLSNAFEKHPIFPTLFPDIIRIGEETGTFEDALSTLATVYEQEAEQGLNRAVGMLEPALILFIGGVVGVIAITIISTVYSILPNIK